MKVKFYTLGCKVNQYDTQNMRERFLEIGFKEAPKSKKADFCLINTCTVTSSADQKSCEAIRRCLRENPKAKIIVTGCLTELDSGMIRGINKDIIIIKNADKEKIVEILGSRSAGRGISFFEGHTRAFLKIQDGCKNFCSYCKVPLVRGMPKSKPLQEIIQEAKVLVKNGFKEIVLTGICLGSYGQDNGMSTDLTRVIDEIEKIKGLFRIRLSSIEAGDVTEGLINMMAKSKKLCPHLHIPIQSGDDSVLKRMNRRYTSREYLSLIKKVQAKIPGIAITTDVMVGFPGEAETNFCNTVKLIKKICPLKVHIFPYSLREGTKAAGFKPKVEPEIISRRIGLLKKEAYRCTLEYRKKFLNKSINVLIEGRCKDDSSYWEGYSDNYINVRIRSGQSLKNKIILTKMHDYPKR